MPNVWPGSYCRATRPSSKVSQGSHMPRASRTSLELPLSGQRGEKLAELGIEFVGRHESSIGEVGTEVNSNLLIADVSAEG